MNRPIRKLLAWTLALIMLIGMMPVDAMAAIIKTDTSNVVRISDVLPGIRSIIDPETPTHTYIFVVEGGTSPSPQIVKDGEKLIEPAAPVKENHKFVGWFTDVDDETTRINFSNPITGITTSETITVTAKFVPVLYVFFMDNTTGDARVFRTKEGIEGDTVSTTDVKLPIGSTQGVTGWYKDQSLNDGPVGSNYIIGTSNQQLWPDIKEGKYLYFNTGENATYIEPQFVAPGANTVAPANPTRPATPSSVGL